MNTASCANCSECACKNTSVEYKYSDVNENDTANIEIVKEKK